MIEAKMPKDIRVYKTKLIGSLTFRQLICFLIAGIVDFILYIAVIEPFHISAKVVIYLVILIDSPIIAFGYIEPMGMPLEKYINKVLIRSFLAPRIRKTKNIIYKMHDPKYSDKDRKHRLKKERKLVKTHPEYERL